MISMGRPQILIFSALSAVQIANALSILEMVGTNSSCSTGFTPCGPGNVCCPPGNICNTRRGIPACEDLSNPVFSSFTGETCADPYLRDCDKTGVKGFCCPIGTVCYYNGIDTALTCINAYGSSAPAYPSSTSGVIPSATPVANTEADVVYSPQDAWSTFNKAPSCAEGSSIRVTSTLNASVSFSYSGPSVMVHTITSPTGGVFAVFIDGFNTTSTLDTFSSSSSSQTPFLPLCYPTQYPPVLIPPPDMETKDSHTITLVYVGPSPNAPAGMESSVQFDAFAIPDFSKVLSPLTSGAMEGNRMTGQGGFIASIATMALVQMLLINFGY